MGIHEVIELDSCPSRFCNGFKRICNNRRRLPPPRARFQVPIGTARLRRDENDRKGVATFPKPLSSPSPFQPLFLLSIFLLRQSSYTSFIGEFSTSPNHLHHNNNRMHQSLQYQHAAFIVVYDARGGNIWMHNSSIGWKCSNASLVKQNEYPFPYRLQNTIHHASLYRIYLHHYIWLHFTRKISYTI